MAGDVNLEFPGAFVNTTLLMSSLKHAKKLIISIKIPRLDEVIDSSWPLNAHAFLASHLTASIEVLSHKRFSNTCYEDCAIIT